jgi:hypothetical protein
MLVGEGSLSSHVEADHGDRNARLEDDTRGFGIDVNVELRCWRDVPARERPAHHDYPFDHVRQFCV